MIDALWYPAAMVVVPLTLWLAKLVIERVATLSIWGWIHDHLNRVWIWYHLPGVYVFIAARAWYEEEEREARL